MIAPEERPGTTETRRSTPPFEPGGCPTCHEREQAERQLRRERREAALKRREVVMWVFLGTAVLLALCALYAVGSPEWGYGWAGLGAVLAWLSVYGTWRCEVRR